MLGDALAWTSTCPSCGCLVADEAVHRRFHEAIEKIWQEAFGLSDEEAEQAKREALAKLAAQSGNAPGAAPADA